MHGVQPEGLQHGCGKLEPRRHAGPRWPSSANLNVYSATRCVAGLATCQRRARTARRAAPRCTLCTSCTTTPWTPQLPHPRLRCRDSLRTSTESLKKIQVVAAALGQQRTRDELIPFVTDPQEDDDELLLVLAEQLGELLPFVGGSPHANHLLAPLESLAASDENAVRAASVVSMQTINKGMTAADVSRLFLPLLTRLAHGCYPNRVAACALYANVHPVASAAEQARLRAEFEALTNDDHPVVRRAAAANLARFASAAGTEHVAVFLKLFVKISQDSAPPPPPPPRCHARVCVRPRHA